MYINSIDEKCVNLIMYVLVCFLFVYSFSLFFPARNFMKEVLKGNQVENANWWACLVAAEI